MSPKDLRNRSSRFNEKHPPPPSKPPPEDLGERLATFPRDDGVEIRISWAEYNGKRFLKLAEWNLGRDGVWWPTKGKALTVRAHELAKLGDAVATAMDRVDTPSDSQRPARLTRGCVGCDAARERLKTEKRPWQDVDGTLNTDAFDVVRCTFHTERAVSKGA